MNKSDVIDSLTSRLGDRVVAETAVNGLTDIITRAVLKGEKVSITGFGTFESTVRAARTGRNPQTGAPVKVKKSTAPKFRPGTQFKDAVNGKAKLGREPKHTPLLPAGITSKRTQAALATADIAAPSAATKSSGTSARAKTAAAATKTAPVKAARGGTTATPVAKAAPAKKATATKPAPAKAAPVKSAPAKAAPVKAAAKKAAPVKAPAKKSTARKTAAKKA